MVQKPALAPQPRARAPLTRARACAQSATVPCKSGDMVALIVLICREASKNVSIRTEVARAEVCSSGEGERRERERGHL